MALNMSLICAYDRQRHLATGSYKVNRFYPWENTQSLNMQGCWTIGEQIKTLESSESLTLQG